MEIFVEVPGRPGGVWENAIFDEGLGLRSEFGFGHAIGFVYDESARVDGEEGKPDGGGALDVGFGFEMVGVRAPRFVEIFCGERFLRCGHHFFGRALSAIHFADGLLREDAGEVEFAVRREVAGSGEAEAIAVAERFF